MLQIFLCLGLDIVCMTSQCGLHLELLATYLVFLTFSDRVGSGRRVSGSKAFCVFFCFSLDCFLCCLLLLC